MDRHVDLLGRLYIVSGALAGLAGLALLPLAVAATALGAEAGESSALPARVATSLFGGLGTALLVFAALNVLTGRALRGRRPWARMAGLLLAAVDVFVPPFGTALAAYAIWVLLRQPARELFGMR
jgi:hypothetical protein